MELIKEIMINVLRKEEINIVFPNMKISADKIVEMESYKALKKSKPSLKRMALMILCALKKLFAYWKAWE